jgi:uncharacterized cupredoxin-like copper-binding protein
MPLKRAARAVPLFLAIVLVAGCSALPLGVPMGHQGLSSRGMMGDSVAVAPGSPGFVAGTPAAPRVVAILAGPGYRFSPPTVTVVAGETITFAVTAAGPAVHEFKVGPLDAVLADGDVPEIAGITMMQTRTLTYTFSGDGPFGYACHEPGHFEAGMQGRVLVVTG